jgi:hypothetical protein
MTRAVLRALCRESLSDLATWPDSTVNAWITDAIRDYSNYFPYTTYLSKSCVTGTKEYDLSSSGAIVIYDLVSVEYPTGEDPVRFLSRVSRQSAVFEDQAVYDWVYPTLFLGEDPATGETIEVYYQTQHTAPGDDTTALTLPAKHYEIIKLYVQFMAIKTLELEESIDPNTKELLLSMLGLNAVRAERVYRAKIEDHLKRSAPGGITPGWAMDKNDRIY